MWRTLVVTFALMSATACTSESGAQSDAHAPSSSATDPSPVPSFATQPTPLASRESKVLEAVKRFVFTTVTVNDPPDPDHPDLARYRTGEVLDNAIESVRQNQLLGIAYRHGTSAAPAMSGTIVSLDDEAAIVRNCIVDNVQQVALSDGHVLNDAVATKLFETTLWWVDGTWKVARNSLVQRWEGVAGCAVSS
jgi:hypothetical protein